MSAPPPVMQVAGRTDVGLIREHNEDNFLVVDLGKAEPRPLDGNHSIELRSAGALIIVCDGMGGAAAGEVASSMAIETVSSRMLTPSEEPGVEARVAFARRLREAAFEANRRIHQASLSDEGHAGMGTTMTCLGVVGQDLVMAQVGDSRAYVLRHGVLTQVTRDQSLVNQLVETGQITEEQARMFEHSNVILQALGVQEDVEVLLSTVPLRRGDRVVVCTDGLSGVVSDDEMAAVVGSAEDLDDACRLLVEVARAAGGPDNITAVVARFDGEGLPLPGEDESVVYSRWRLDEPDPPEDEAPTTVSWEPSAPTLPRPRIDPARTFFSLMVLLALTLGGLVLASQLRRNGAAVRCSIEAPPGLRVRIDGRDVGLLTRSGGTELKLRPGRHRLGLRGYGAPADERAVDVVAGEMCQVRFDAAPPADEKD